jgi:putative membrane protein
MIAHTSAAEHAVIVLLGVVAVLLYGLGWVGRPQVSRWRLVSWAAAVVVTLIATMPAVERWAERSFTGHMAQHLLLIVLAAPLYVAAQPVRTFRQLPWLAHRRVPGERALTRWWHRVGAVAAPVAFLGVLYLTHLTDLYEMALDHRVVHDLEHVAYLASAIALWAVVIGPGRGVMTSVRTATMATASSATTATPAIARPGGGAARVGTAMAVIAGMALLGVVLMSASEPLVPTYVEALGRDEALDDQRLAASFMWAGGMGLTLPLLLASVWIWAAAE